MKTMACFGDSMTDINAFGYVNGVFEVFLRNPKKNKSAAVF